MGHDVFCERRSNRRCHCPFGRNIPQTVDLAMDFATSGNLSHPRHSTPAQFPGRWSPAQWIGPGRPQGVRPPQTTTPSTAQIMPADSNSTAFADQGSPRTYRLGGGPCPARIRPGSGVWDGGQKIQISKLVRYAARCRPARAGFHPRLRSTLILRLISAGHPPAPSLSVAGRALQNTRPRNRVENPMSPPFDMVSHSNKWVLRFELPTSHYRTAQRPHPLLECVQTSNETTET